MSDQESRMSEEQQSSRDKCDASQNPTESGGSIAKMLSA